METKHKRTRRALAFLIDWVILGLPFCLLSNLVRLPVPGSVTVFVFCLAIAFMLVTLVLRDYLFLGRSLGKRMMKLKVVDAGTLTVPSAKKLIIKNLFLFVFTLDGIVLAASGKSLGERATNTIVLDEKQLPVPEAGDAPPQPGASGIKPAAVTASAVVCIAIAAFLLMSGMMNSVKKQEDYRAAHTYLVNSAVYAGIRAEESQIALAGYSYSSKTDSATNAKSEESSFLFYVRGQAFRVVCHRDGGVWYVCSECTEFQ